MCLCVLVCVLVHLCKCAGLVSGCVLVFVYCTCVSVPVLSVQMTEVDPGGGGGGGGGEKQKRFVVVVVVVGGGGCAYSWPHSFFTPPQ